MKQPSIQVGDKFREGFDQIRAEFEITDKRSTEIADELAQEFTAGLERADLGHLDFITIDPKGSIDLDQALRIEANEAGYRVLYAIADVAEFIQPSGPIAKSTLDQGVTFYSPDQRNGLHPEEISEDRASLLEGTTKPCVLWDITLDETGSVQQATLSRAVVSISKTYSYSEAQSLLDDGNAPDTLRLLETVGKLRLQIERDRGGVSIRLPSQEVIEQNGQYQTTFEMPREVEKYNAQISLMTGMIAGAKLSAGGVGVLRTLPPAPTTVVENLRSTAAALNLTWDETVSYADFVRGLHPESHAELAFLNQATAAFRGASYINLEDVEADIEDIKLEHAAIASVYAHVTAPLRRLVDRYNNEILIALEAGRDIPQWVADDLADIPSIMNKSKSAASSLDRAMTNFVEVMVLTDRVGETFDAKVINERHYSGNEISIVQIDSPAIVTELDKIEAKPGQAVQLRLSEVSIQERKLKFEVV